MVDNGAAGGKVTGSFLRNEWLILVNSAGQNFLITIESGARSGRRPECGIVKLGSQVWPA
jgi:hypothetical protein